MQTAELLLTRRAIQDLLSARALGVMHGPAGSGKTFAAELAVADVKVERHPRPGRTPSRSPS